MRFVGGIRHFFSGARLALSMDNARFVVAPALTSLVIVSTGVWLSLSYLGDYTNSMVANLPSWLGFLANVLLPILYLVGALAGVWLFGLLAAVIGSVFLGDLALKIDARDPSGGSWAQQLRHALGREATKLRYHIPRLIGLLLLGFIPLINTLTPFLWLVFGAWLMAAQFCDYCCEHRGLSFQHTLATLRRHRLAALGFGMCATLGMAIPILNFLIAPIAVIGGTQLMARCLDADADRD